MNKKKNEVTEAICSTVGQSLVVQSTTPKGNCNMMEAKWQDQGDTGSCDTQRKLNRTENMEKRFGKR